MFMLIAVPAAVQDADPLLSGAGNRSAKVGELTVERYFFLRGFQC